MDLMPGDRVISLIDDFPGLELGECGTYVGTDVYGNYLNIRWDKFNDKRHDGDGEVETGHGWFVDRSSVQCVVEDLGELPSVKHPNMIDNILFGGIK